MGLAIIVSAHFSLEEQAHHESMSVLPAPRNAIPVWVNKIEK
jgi:hypothetical protein